jgi:hypothetical protein
MRCPTCGTDNAPDSRFCGGCGARVSGVEHRVAPTKKLSDDAAWRQDAPLPVNPAPAAVAGPVPRAVTAPPEMPPPLAALAPGSIPPQNTPSIPPQNVTTMPAQLGSVPPQNAPMVQVPPRDVVAAAAFDQTTNVVPSLATPRSVSTAVSPSPPPPVQQSGPVVRPSGELPRPNGTRPSGDQLAMRPDATPPPAPVQASSPSVSAVPPRSRAWIGVVVALDVALAAAGAWMLAQGLRTADATTSAPAATPVTAAPGPGAGSGSQAPAILPSQTPPTPAVIERHAAAGSGSASASVAGSASASGSGSASGSAKPRPLDPYATPSNATPGGETMHNAAGLAALAAAGSPSGSDEPDATAEVAADLDRIASHSKPIFDHCYSTATKALPADQPLSGTLKIAFQVLPDGKIAHAAAVQNTTGSEQLASCMVNEVGGWVLHPHTGATIDFARDFAFQPQQGAP